MTPHRLLSFVLLIVAAGCSGDAAGPATGPRTTTNSVMAASAMPLLGANASGATLDPGCASVVGTLYGEHEKPPAVPVKGWYGTLYLSIAGGTVETAGFFDHGTGAHRTNAASGVFGGKETNTITFSPGNTFDIEASYNAPPTGTPGLFVLHETGKITNGSGDFDGVSGHVAVDGPFTFPPDGADPQWIGEMHGSICGLQ
jgi:hypothetical protein